MSTVRRHQTTLALILTTILGWAEWAPAISPPDLAPQFDSPAYWDTHDIAHALVRINNTDEGPILHVLDQYSDGPAAQAILTLKVNEAWLEPHGNEIQPVPTLDNYDHVFIASPRARDQRPSVILKIGRNEVPALAESCRLIQEFRKTPDLPKSFTRAVAAGDALAQRYVVNAFLAVDLKAFDPAVLANVQALRADKAADLNTRMLASDLVQKVAQANGQKKDDWDWIAGVLREEKSLPSTSFQDLAQRLVINNREDRRRTIDLICTLATDMDGPQRRRFAVISPGNLSDLIDLTAPRDPGNQKLFNLCLSLMSDPSPSVRSTSGWAMWQLSARLVLTKVPQGEWTPILRREITALKNAEGKETADDMKIWLKTYRERIEQMLPPPPPDAPA